LWSNVKKFRAGTNRILPSYWAREFSVSYSRVTDSQEANIVIQYEYSDTAEPLL